MNLESSIRTFSTFIVNHSPVNIRLISRPGAILVGRSSSGADRVAECSIDGVHYQSHGGLPAPHGLARVDVLAIVGYRILVNDASISLSLTDIIIASP